MKGKKAELPHTAGIRRKIANRDKFVKGREYRLFGAKKRAEKNDEEYTGLIEARCVCGGLPKYGLKTCFRPGGSACVRRGLRLSQRQSI